MPAADALLEGNSPYVLDHVYEANACQPFDWRFSSAVTRPSYVNGIRRDSSTESGVRPEG
jgi:hypothetical protein